MLAFRTPDFMFLNWGTAITDVCNSAVCHDSTDFLRFYQFADVDMHTDIGFITYDFGFQCDYRWTWVELCSWKTFADINLFNWLFNL